MAATQDWIVTASGERPLKEVVEGLAQAGFEVGEVLSEIGVVTGRCAGGRVAKLRRLAGVGDVSASQSVDVGPPGSVDTW